MKHSGAMCRRLSVLSWEEMAGADFAKDLDASQPCDALTSIAVLPQAMAGTDPTSVHFARDNDALQRAFWSLYVRQYIYSSEPQLNFVAKGGEAAIVANLYPRQKVSRLCQME